MLKHNRADGRNRVGAGHKNLWNSVTEQEPAGTVTPPVKSTPGDVSLGLVLGITCCEFLEILTPTSPLFPKGLTFSFEMWGLGGGHLHQREISPIKRNSLVWPIGFFISVFNFG